MAKTIEASKGYLFLVSDIDYNEITKHKWQADVRKDRVYIKGSSSKVKKNKSPIYIHRFIMKPPKGYVVDHKNRNTLDNRRENLRICTSRENNANRKNNSIYGLKGITKLVEKTGKVKWCAKIKWECNKTRNLGHYNTMIEAANAYNNAAIKVFGEFARINNI